MPTGKQLKERAVLISEFAEEVKEQGVDVIKKFEYKYRTDVYVLALARGYVSVDDIPPNKAREVSEKLLKKAPDRIRDESAAIGTAVHDIVERLANGEVFDVDPMYAGHVASWRQFMSDWQVEVLRTEFTVMSETYQYAGTADLLFRSGNHPELGVILGDYKSSQSGIWPDIALQLAALKYADYILKCTALPHVDGYQHKPEDAEIVRGVLETIDSFVGIQITSEGYKVVPVHVDKTTFDIFRCAQGVAHWTTDLKEKALSKAEFIKVGA